MALDPAEFHYANTLGINQGDRVVYVNRRLGEGEGVVTLIWMGIEETFDIAHDDGTTITCYPALGDSVAVQIGREAR